MKRNQNLTSYIKQIFILTAIAFSFNKIKAPVTCTNLTNHPTTNPISENQNNVNENYVYYNDIANIPTISNNEDEFIKDFNNTFKDMVTKRSDIDIQKIADVEREILRIKNELERQKEISLIPKPPENERISDNIPIKNNLPQTSYEEMNIPKLKIPNNTASIEKTNKPKKLAKQKTVSKFNMANKNLQSRKSPKNLHNPEQKTLNKFNAPNNNSGINKKRRNSSVGMNNKLFVDKSEKDYLAHLINNKMKNTKISPSNNGKLNFKQPSKIEKSSNFDKNKIEKKPEHKLIRHSSVGTLFSNPLEETINKDFEDYYKKIEKETLIDNLF